MVRCIVSRCCVAVICLGLGTFPIVATAQCGQAKEHVINIALAYTEKHQKIEKLQSQLANLGDRTEADETRNAIKLNIKTQRNALKQYRSSLLHWTQKVSAECEGAE